MSQNPQLLTGLGDNNFKLKRSMNLKKTKLAVILLLLSILGQAQINKKEKKYNPFESIGKKGEVLTAYGDKFIENFDTDSVQRIGSVLINIYQKRIVMLLDADSTFQKVSDNSSASRWYSVDPLAAKGNNISYSPYTFVYNNPINYIDPDGQDGIKVIDTKNKTITVHAVYYVQTQTGFKGDPMPGYSAKDVAKMNESINGQLNKKGFTVSEGDYAGYTVTFDLVFKDGGKIGDAKTSAAAEKMDGISIGNTFTAADGDRVGYFKAKENEETGTSSQVGGVTIGHKEIVMNDNTDTKRNRIHEIFHTLFFDQDGAKKGIGSYDRVQMPNQADINTLINNTLLPSVIKKDEEKK